jgi:hypothetical protein
MSATVTALPAPRRLRGPAVSGGKPDAGTDEGDAALPAFGKDIGGPDRVTRFCKPASASTRRKRPFFLADKVLTIPGS